MIWKKRLSLFLSVVIVISMVQIVPSDISGALSAANKVMGEKSISPGAPDASPTDPDVSPTDPDEEVKEAVLRDLTVSYNEKEDTIVLRYHTQDCSYVKIYLEDGGYEKTLENKYTGTEYEYDKIDDGRAYTFRVEPYNIKDEAGASASVSCEVPFKQAVVDDADADYNLERQVLIVDWQGDNILYADVYQDDVLIGERIRDGRLIYEVKLEPTSKHTYRIVPYNKNDEVGIEKSFVLEVDDYVARIDYFVAEYDENAKKIQMNWESTYTEYVEIYLNDEVLAEKYTGKSFVFDCELQPGAAYIVSIEPYNYKDDAGEGDEEDVSFGYFDIPEEFSASLVNIPIKDRNGNYTGFASPSVQLKWEAQAKAVYEIYRAEGDDKRRAYNWIANVKAAKDGVYTYIDEKAGFKTYYYKIRRKIVLDPYTEQELYTALSEAEKVNAAVPKPSVKACLNENGQIELAVNSGREFVSGYEIYRKSGSEGYRLIATITGDEYTDEDIEFGKTYRYRAKAYYYNPGTGKKAKGKYSKAAKVKNSINNIQAEAVLVSEDTIKVSWTPAANAQKYEVYVKSGMQGDSYVLWKTTDALSLKRTVKSGGTYYFMVKAYQTSENGKTYFSSAETSVKMGFAAPRGLTVKKTDNKQNKNTKILTQKDTLTWNTVYGAKGYYLEVYNAATKKYNRVAKISGRKNNSYTVSNPVTEGAAPIKYRISAYAGGKVKKGDILEIKPGLGKSEKVTAVKSGSKVKVKWKKVLGAERYQVYRSNGRTMILIGETAALSITDQGLSAAVPYKYYVQAVNLTQKITGEKSEPVSYLQNQEEVADLKAVNTSEGTVQLSWKESRGAQNYVIYYKTSANAKYEKVTEVTGKKTSFEHKNLKAGCTCYYKVTAKQTNSGGILVESEGAAADIKVNK